MTGTTILAFVYQDGVMCVADTRTSSGSFVGNRASDKIDYISDFIIGMRTGVSSVTHNTLREAAYEL
jgi:20S proteasome subunit beta 1